MRCDTVIHELSTPSGNLDRSALAVHLADCPRCAAFSSQVGQLQQVWDLTRPAEPSPEAFDALWAKVMIAADEPETFSIASAPRWKRWGVAAMVAAQAAALLVAGVAALKSHPGEVRPVSTETVSVAKVPSPMLEFTAEEGTTLIVTLDGLAGDTPRVRVSDQITPSDDSPTDMVAVDFDVLNYMESL